MKKSFIIDKNYLHIPVNSTGDNSPVNLEFTEDPKSNMLLHLIPATTEDCDFVSTLNLKEHKGQKIELSCGNPVFFENISWGDTPPEKNLSDDVTKRPQLHFTCKHGWLNDPNGLFYFDGLWHMFCQYNPFRANWGNMSWNHAVSKDLVHWEEKEVVLYPDASGSMYSGGAWVDYKNDSGLQEDPAYPPILLFYTCAGNNAPVECPYTQSLAYSTDGGKSFCKYEKNPIVQNIAGERERDPNIAYDEESGEYIMVLYLGDGTHEFACLASKNLLDWEVTDCFTVPNCRECPDLFPLVDEETGLKKWVFIEANGRYLVGRIENRRFFTETDVDEFFYRKVGTFGYAGQSFRNVADGKRIYIAWQQAEREYSKIYSQSMTFPVELKLKNSKLHVFPYENLESLRSKSQSFTDLTQTPDLDFLKDTWEMEFKTRDSGKVDIRIGGVSVTFDSCKKEISFDGDIIPYPEEEQAFEGRIFVDRNVIEMFDHSGNLWIAKNVDLANSPNGLVLEDINVEDGGLSKATFYKLDSIWK